MAAVGMTSDVAGRRIESRLPVTSKAGCCLPGSEKLVVYRSVRIVARTAAVSQCIVFKDKGASHFLVALKALFAVAQQHSAARGPNVASVHVMAIRTRHPAFDNRMVMLEHEFAFDIKMTAKAGFCISHQDIAGLASSVFDVNAARSVAGLAAFGDTGFGVFIGYPDGNSGMLIELEISLLGLVAIRSGAGFGAYILGARYRGWGHNDRLIFEHAARADEYTQTCR